MQSIILTVQQFINREFELDFLNRKYAENSPKMVVLYGKGRNGKTELTKKFMQDKEGPYILCTKDSMKENIEEMKAKFHNLTRKERLRENGFVVFDLDDM